PNCATTAEYSETQMGSDPFIRFDQTKPQKIKGQTKLTTAVRIRAVLNPDEPIPGNKYLKVTGPGIVPVGNVCQLQVADAGVAPIVVEPEVTSTANPLSTHSAPLANGSLDPHRVCFLVQFSPAVLATGTGDCDVAFDAEDGWSVTAESGIALISY